jgi:hypothetical protein
MTPYRTTGRIASALREAQTLDRLWMGKIAGAGDDRHTPWMPFPAPEFIAMLAGAVTEADNDQPRFLEVGCGIGTRMMLAREIFGLDVAGIERVPEYVHQAHDLSLRVWEADARDWDHYGEYEIIWFNRPFRDRVLQADLERQIWDEARPGTVIMCANLERKPPSSWLIVDDDWEARRGVWQKPPESTS